MNIAGYYKCDAVEPGEGGGKCGCVEESTLVGVSYECDINWDISAMLSCATNIGVCAVSCLASPIEPASCADCLCTLEVNCCDGACSDLCDFIEACEEDEGNPVDEWKTVFKYFEGDSCGE